MSGGTQALKKYVLPALPYLLIFWFANKLGEAYRLAEGGDALRKLAHIMESLDNTMGNPLPSFETFDLCVGLGGALIVFLAVLIRKRNAKKWRKNVEYGSARFGTKKDIKPFMDKNPENNIILTQSEGLTMNPRPSGPKYARNKNVLVIGGSGSGKTRFFIKPNLMQCRSKDFPVSFVVTDPKGTIVLEAGKMLQKHGYKIKILNTINFKKSHHYNPFPLLYKGGKRNNPQNTRQSLRLRHTNGRTRYG